MADLGDVFCWPFTIESGYQAKNRSLRIQFGDGYEQEMPDGLTGPLITWKVIVAHLDGYESEKLEEYLKENMRLGQRIRVRHPDTGALLTMALDGYRWSAPSGLLRSFDIDMREVKEWP